MRHGTIFSTLLSTILFLVQVSLVCIGAAGCFIQGRGEEANVAVILEPEGQPGTQPHKSMRTMKGALDDPPYALALQVKVNASDFSPIVGQSIVEYGENANSAEVTLKAPAGKNRWFSAVLFRFDPASQDFHSYATEKPSGVDLKGGETKTITLTASILPTGAVTLRSVIDEEDWSMFIMDEATGFELSTVPCVLDSGSISCTIDDAPVGRSLFPCLHHPGGENHCYPDRAFKLSNEGESVDIEVELE